MPKLDLTRTREIKVSLGSIGKMKTSSWYWERPVSPEDRPETGREPREEN